MQVPIELDEVAKLSAEATTQISDSPDETGSPGTTSSKVQSTLGLQCEPDCAAFPQPSFEVRCHGSVLWVDTLVFTAVCIHHTHIYVSCSVANEE